MCSRVARIHIIFCRFAFESRKGKGEREEKKKHKFMLNVLCEKATSLKSRG